MSGTKYKIFAEQANEGEKEKEDEEESKLYYQHFSLSNTFQNGYNTLITSLKKHTE